MVSDIIDNMNGINIDDDFPDHATLHRVQNAHIPLTYERQTVTETQETHEDFYELRKRLITHFNYLFKNKDIVWPHKAK